MMPIGALPGTARTGFPIPLLKKIQPAAELMLPVRPKMLKSGVHDLLTMMQRMSSSSTTWSMPTVWPGNFALFPQTMA